MRISFVSDIHGNDDGLARVARSAEQLVVLGDLLDYIDYQNPAAGILGEMFGAQRVLPIVALRSVGDFAGMHWLTAQLWDSVADPVGTLTDIVTRRYTDMLGALSLANNPPLVILGNVDVKSTWEIVAGSMIEPVDGHVVQLAGARFGFVGGGVSAGRRPVPVPRHDGGGAEPTRGFSAWVPYLRSAADYTAAVEGLGPVDVLCSHLPARLPLLRYDRVPARLEAAGPGLLEFIDTYQPRLSVSGHIHQPQAQRTRRGRTECVNVGHFARDPRAYEINV